MQSAELANRRYFREAYRTGRHGWEAVEPSPQAVSFLKRVRRRVHEGAMLDVGCGEGRHCLAAWRLGFQVFGIDYEPLALARARRSARLAGAAGIGLRKASVFSLPFPPASFDLVLDYGCLHHQKKLDWGTYRTSILRVLKPRGFYILSVFSPAFRLFHRSRRPWHVAYGAYRRCFTRQDIESLFGRQFELLRISQERGEGRGFWHVLMKLRS